MRIGSPADTSAARYRPTGAGRTRWAAEAKTSPAGKSSQRAAHSMGTSARTTARGRPREDSSSSLANLSLPCSPSRRGANPRLREANDVPTRVSAGRGTKAAAMPGPQNDHPRCDHQRAGVAFRPQATRGSRMREVSMPVRSWLTRTLDTGGESDQATGAGANRASKGERRVFARGVSASHSATRTTLSAAAVRRCWRCVLAKPM